MAIEDPIGCSKIFRAEISEKDFLRLRDFIEQESGIKMPFTKKVMLEARLRKRLRALGYRSFEEYCDYLFSPEGMEHEHVPMIDVITTNKTDFFREPSHFDYLVQTVVPEMIRDSGAGVKKPFMIWSAGCSTGEEPYTLAMVMSGFRERYPGGVFDFVILATDISTAVLERARTGIYQERRLEFMPKPMKKKYLLRSKDRTKALVRIVPELRDKIGFRRINFLEEDFGFSEKVDIIFCRNVIIYFERPIQEKVLNSLCRWLVPGGYLFMGHSETLHGLHVPLEAVSPTIYRHIS